jgi:hypothetical protein
MSKLKTVGRALDKLSPWIAIGLIALGFSQIHSQGVSEESLRTAQLRSCHRLNVIRAEDNRSHFDDYRFDSTLAALLRISLAQPQEPDRRLSPSQQAGDRHLVDEFTSGLEADAKDKQWTELAKCVPATDDPLTYVPPSPIPFSKQLPPPSTLTVGPGE